MNLQELRHLRGKLEAARDWAQLCADRSTDTQEQDRVYGIIGGLVDCLTACQRIEDEQRGQTRMFG